MATEREPDGQRIAERLAERLADVSRERAAVGSDLAVVDVDTDVEPSPDGSMTSEITRDGDRVAAIYAHPDRAHVEFHVAPDEAAAAADSADLRVRPKAVRPPRSLVFVEADAQVEPALDVFSEVLDALD